MKYSYLFINDELIKMLNNLGYTHFVTGNQEYSFIKGRAFYYCIENKKYGYVDVVPNKELQHIKANEDYLISCIAEMDGKDD